MKTATFTRIRLLICINRHDGGCGALFLDKYFTMKIKTETQIHWLLLWTVLI